jgi:hypothetical protein
MDGCVSSFNGTSGVAYYGYDPKKQRYVTLGTGGPGNYGAGYFHITADRTITFEYPDMIDNDVYTAADTFRLAPSPSGYAGMSSGPSDRYPGVHYKTTFSCARQ